MDRVFTLDPLTTSTVKAKSSAGLLIENSTGADVLLLGAGPSQGITAYGQINGTSISLSGGITCTTVTASSSITASVNVDSFPVLFSASNLSSGAAAGAGFSFSTGDSSGYVGCFSAAYATAVLADRVALGANSAAAAGAGIYIPAAGQTFDVIGSGGVTARFFTGGSAAIGATALIASERLRVAGQLRVGTSGVNSIFDSAAASDARMEFQRNGVRQGLFSWDTATLTFEGDVTAGSSIIFRAGGSQRYSLANTGLHTFSGGPAPGTPGATDVLIAAGGIRCGAATVPSSATTGTLVLSGGMSLMNGLTGIGVYLGGSAAGSAIIASAYGDLLKHRQYGFGGYWATCIGDGSRGIGLGVDPGTVAGGSFTGNNTDFFFARGVCFGTPNSGSTDWLWAIQINGGAIAKSLSRIRIDDTGMGFFGASPVARPSLAAATGTATRTTFDTATVTTAQLAERVKALIDDMRSYGLEG
jgi:hypothetical protein